MAKKPVAKTPTAPTYPVNPALEAAVIAHAEEDTPRLVYADWLDENGDPDRAAFIRNQVALWDKNPADEDYVDLIEQRLETRVRANLQRLAPQLPSAVEFRYPESTYYRGFPYFATQGYNLDGPRFRPEDVSAFCQALPEAFQTSTIRGLRLSSDYTPHLPQIFATPITEQITALDLHDYRIHRDEPLTDMVANLSQSDVPRQLRWLEISGDVQTPDLERLACVSFENLVRFGCRTIRGSVDATSRFLESLSARKVRRLQLQTEDESTAGLLVLAHFPELHSLELVHTPWAESALAGGKRYPSLARLQLYRIDFGADWARQLASVEFPNLTALEFHGDHHWGMMDEGIRVLAETPLFERLRCLDVSDHRLTDAAVKAIASSPAAKNLRFLCLDGNEFREDGLKAIAKPGTFPNLTTLHLGVAGIGSRKTSPDDVASFLREWSSPALRHLNLNYWPLGSVGAKALAENPAFGNLRWLELNYIGDVDKAAFRAVAESRHLSNVVYLSLYGTPVDKWADVLRDPNCLPNLAECAGLYVEEPMRTQLGEARPNVRWA